jgi:hypothetical protein
MADARISSEILFFAFATREAVVVDADSDLHHLAAIQEAGVYSETLQSNS